METDKKNPNLELECLNEEYESPPLEDEDDTFEFEGEVYDLDELEDVVLSFADDEDDIDFADSELMVKDILGEYSFAEILDFNDMTEAEALAHLFYSNIVGLPTEIEDEALESVPEEEASED